VEKANEFSSPLVIEEWQHCLSNHAVRASMRDPG